MNQNVTKPRHAAPFDLRMAETKILQDMFGGFPDNFEIAQDSILNQRIAHEIRLIHILQIAQKFFTGTGNVQEVKTHIRRFHNSTASATTRRLR